MQIVNELPKGDTWAITKNVLDGTELSASNADQLEKLFPHKFRMYDDDGILYYEGLSNDDSSFDPLDDCGTPNDGATEIHYYNSKTRKYEHL